MKSAECLLEVYSEKELLLRALKECKLCQTQHVIRDSNPDFRITLDSDVCQIGPKML